MEPGRTLISGFLRSVERHPSRPALEVDGETLSYTELYGRAGAIAAELGVPRRFELRRELPLNPNGKLDRRALRESLR